jgi:hypothetical protein
MLALRDSLLRVLEYVHLEVCRCERLLGDGDIRVDAGAVGRTRNPIQTDARMRGGLSGRLPCVWPYAAI